MRGGTLFALPTREACIFATEPSVSRGVWPTLLASGWRSGKVSASLHEKNARPLAEVIELDERAAGRDTRGMFPNPQWLEAFMGFPHDWTKLPGPTGGEVGPQLEVRRRRRRNRSE